jgi:hypothetical protein
MRGTYVEAYCPCLKVTYSTTKTVTEPTQDPAEHEQPCSVSVNLERVPLKADQQLGA